MIESNVDIIFQTPIDDIFIRQLNLQIKTIKHKIETIIPHRHKRGLVYFRGTVFKWIFGTMNDNDRDEIEGHLKTVDINVHNSISSINKQIRINTDFKANLESLKERIRKNQELTENLLNDSLKLNGIIIKQLHFLQVVTDLKLLTKEIEKLQENVILFAKHHIMGRSFLTTEEIEYYGVDLNKMQELKSSPLKTELSTK